MAVLYGYAPTLSSQILELAVGTPAECQTEGEYLDRVYPHLYTHLGVYPGRVAGRDFIPQYFLRNCSLAARRAWSA